MICRFKFSIADYPTLFDYSLIETYGWYSPANKKNNLNGISRDHLLSVKHGYELGIDPTIISHPANCNLVRHTENQVKNIHSSITIDELMTRIYAVDREYEGSSLQN